VPVTHTRPPHHRAGRRHRLPPPVRFSSTTV